MQLTAKRQLWRPQVPKRLDLWLIWLVISTQNTRQIVKRMKTVALKEQEKTKENQQKKSPRVRKVKVKRMGRK